ncbi:uncharacterized protein LOC123544069 [Mercenaria mercenaria]|uniref:uncharacterized protein LOC123544069 n=1 Tax=Mercenaria mercenaria TaxID=6596 RepID=UPI00234F29A4|nr:uncharacterized protein LOC123544069 [Mercenaria mercenaria]
MCPKSHNSLTWTSQPVLPNGVMVGNFKIYAAIVMSGNNYSKVALMAKFMRLGFPSASMFDRIQGQYIIPEVDRYWLTIKQSTQEELRATSIVVAGDGRMDSPGHSAKYCTYTVMNQTDKKIVSMEVIDKREVQLKSGQLEVRGFRKTMDDIKDAGIEVKEIVTDAHPQISSIMRRDFPDIRHSWDMWHGAKNLGKKLHAVALEKGNSQLKPWVQDITNHFFYSAETCNGDRDVLQMKFVSVMNHSLNVHRWALGGCDHEEIDQTVEREKEWLDPDGSSIIALEKIIMDHRFQSNLGHYVTCQTTSEIESFNNHLLMYVSKRHAFTYASYKCRCQLAAIDYMHHLNRPLRKNKKGEFYYCRTFSKAANHWGFKYVKVPKDYSYIPEMMIAVLSVYCKSFKERPLSKKRLRARMIPV